MAILAGGGSIVACVAVLLFLVAIVHDVRTREIPDWVSLAFVVMGLLVLPHGAWGRLLGAGILFCLFYALWVVGGIGGGDVKLIASSSLLFPPLQQMWYLLDIALAGGVLAFAYLALRRWGSTASTAPYGRLLRVECWRIRRGGPLPYAVAIFAGFAVTALRGGL